MVHGRQNFGPAPKHKSGEVKETARRSAEEAANERLRATRQETPHESGGDNDLKRELETAHDGQYQRRTHRENRSRDRE